MFLGSKKGRKATKKVVKLGGKAAAPVIVIGGISVLALLLYKKWKESNIQSYQADPDSEVVETVISEENIHAIAQDVALSTIQSVNDIALAQNDQFISLDKAREQVEYFKEQVLTLEAAISQQNASIATKYDSQIAAQKIELDSANSSMTAAYGDYVTAQNNFAEKQADLAEKQDKAAEYEGQIWNVGVWGSSIVLGSEIHALQQDVDILQSIANEKWGIYLDAQNLRNTEQNAYNSLLEQKAADSAELNELRSQLSAATDNLNIWQVSYEAAETVSKELAFASTYSSVDKKAIVPQLAYAAISGQIGYLDPYYVRLNDFSNRRSWTDQEILAFAALDFKVRNNYPGYILPDISQLHNDLARLL